MESRTASRHVVVFGLALVAAMGTAQASGARQGVKAKPGEIVLLRDVSTRPAYRPAPPGMALIADTSPSKELGGALGPGSMDELGDADYAALGSGMVDPQHQVQGQTTVERVTGGMVGSTLGRVSGEDGMLSGSRLSQTIGGPMGTVSRATGGIGEQVRGALAQFPRGQPAGTGGK